jgi:hypothetical protein
LKLLRWQNACIAQRHDVRGRWFVIHREKTPQAVLVAHSATHSPFPTQA